MTKKTGSIGYGHTGPCQPDCTCDIAKAVREVLASDKLYEAVRLPADDSYFGPIGETMGKMETTVRTHLSVAMMLAHHWAADCAIDLTDPHERELERRIAEALRTVEREALERAAKHCRDSGYLGSLNLAAEILELNGDSLLY